MLGDVELVSYKDVWGGVIAYTEDGKQFFFSDLFIHERATLTECIGGPSLLAFLNDHVEQDVTVRDFY